MAIHDQNPTPGAGQPPSSTGQALSPAMRRRLQQCFERGTQNTQSGNFDYATEMFTQCVIGDPGNLVYAQAFLGNLHRKYNNNKKGGTLAGIRTAGTKASMMKAGMRKEWLAMIHSGLEVLKLNPWDTGALLQMARACGELGFVECQLGYLKGALDADFKNADVNRECAFALTKAGDFDQAIACWTRVDQAKKGGDEEAKREIANLQVEKTMHSGNMRRDAEAEEAADEQSGKPKQAAAPVSPDRRSRASDLEQQIAANPGELLLHAELGEIYAKDEKWADAERVLQRGLEATGGDMRLREQLEEVQLRKARQQLLVAEKRAVEANTQEATQLSQRMKAELNRLETDVFRSRVERYPTNIHWKYELGTRLKLAGNFNEAIKMFQEARSDPKRRGTVLLDLGESFQQIKQYKLAMQHYVQAVDEIPEKEVDRRKQALYRAGVLAMGLKEFNEAEKYLTKLAALDFSYRDVSDRLDKITKLRDSGET